MHDDRTKKFEWRPFLVTQLPCGLVTIGFALLIDSVLRSHGVSIHPWREAVISGVAAMFFSTLLVPVLWRLGLITVSQYMIGAIGVFVPATLLSLVAVAAFQPVIIDMPLMGFEPGGSQAWAMTVYVRISRSIVLFPIYVLAFWAIYHRWLGRTHL